MRVIIAGGAAATCAILAHAVFAQTCDPILNTKLLAQDVTENSFFGEAVATSNDYVAIGASGDNSQGPFAGAVYIFRYIDRSWIYESKLLPDMGSMLSGFGSSVATMDNTAVIGASQDSGNGFQSGSAYIYQYDGSTWSIHDRLTPADGVSQAQFGVSTSISDNTIAIGASGDDDNGPRSGSVYVYRLINGIWNHESKLVPKDGSSLGTFGNSVSLQGPKLFVGASNSNAAYFFQFDGANWAQVAKLTSSDGTANGFGSSVCIIDNVAVIGAPFDNDNGSWAGAAYIFRHDGSQWNQECKLLASDGAADDRFGHTLSASGDTIVVGAYGDDSPSHSGSAYVYRYDHGNWSEIAKLRAPDRTSLDSFGWSVSISGDTVVAGAHWDDERGFQAGSAYVFDLNCTPNCLADINGDGTLSPADFTAWIAAFNAGNPECDQNADLVCNPADFTAWIANFNAGC